MKSEIEVTVDEINQYAKFIGLDIAKDKDLMWIATEGLLAELPKDWIVCRTLENDVYYFNERTGESMWSHPRDEYYRDMVRKKKQEKQEKEEKKAIQKKVDAILSDGSLRMYFKEVLEKFQSSKEEDIGADLLPEEIENYVEWLGFDPRKFPDLLPIAKFGLKAPLPPNWEACKTNGDTYYFNVKSGQSLWIHPLDPFFQEYVNRRTNGETEGDLVKVVKNARLSQEKKQMIKSFFLERQDLELETLALEQLLKTEHFQKLEHRISDLITRKQETLSMIKPLLEAELKNIPTLSSHKELQRLQHEEKFLSETIEQLNSSNQKLAAQLAESENSSKMIEELKVEQDELHKSIKQKRFILKQIRKKIEKEASIIATQQLRSQSTPPIPPSLFSKTPSSSSESLSKVRNILRKQSEYNQQHLERISQLNRMKKELSLEDRINTLRKSFNAVPTL